MTASANPASGVEKLRRLVQLSLAIFANSVSVRQGRDDRLFASAQDYRSDEPSSLLLDMVCETTGRPKGSLFHGGILRHFFAEGAYEIVHAKAISAYWFWMIVGAAAQRATQLPLSVNDVKQGIEDLRATYAVDGVGEGADLQRRLSAYTGTQLTALLEGGVIYIHTEWNGTCPTCRTQVETLKKSPLFTGMDELFYAAGETLPVTALA